MLETVRQNATAAQRSRSDGVDAHRAQRIRAAWIYYVEGKTQSEVAQILGLNRVAVTRLLSEAKRRHEVTVTVTSEIEDVVALERKLEQRFGIERVVVAPLSEPGADPTRVIAAAAGRHVSGLISNNMTVGVGWGRTLYEMLGFLEPRALRDVRVISCLGGISEAKRYNPAEFAWRFAELYDAEGFLVPAPALVDSMQTKHALVEHCGLDQVFQLAEASDIALLSCGGITNLTTSYRIGHVSETERRSLIECGAVGDVLYNFIDENGTVVDHSVNERCISVSLKRLRRIRERILISGGPEKRQIIPATFKTLEPTVFITDEQTALALAE
ncbi:MAG: sugar-binding transcriptional regulator [Pseudomonadota bacterium]